MYLFMDCMDGKKSNYYWLKINLISLFFSEY